MSGFVCDSVGWWSLVSYPFFFGKTDPLAYLTAKSNGFDGLAAEILESAGLVETDIEDIPKIGTSTLRPPVVVTSTETVTWPTISQGENFFDCALANGALESGVESTYVDGDANTAASSALKAWARDEEIHEEIPPEEGGWELDVDEEGANVNEAVAEEVVEEELGAGATPGADETELWIRNSPLAADHVAAGSFESAMQVSGCSASLSSFDETEFSYSIANLGCATLHP